MRGCIRGNWRHLMVGLLCTAIVISSTALYLTYRQPEVCSLCGSGKRERYQAPVILNLTTGQSNEMRIYDPDLPFSEYEIAPIQTTGTFSFASCAGYTGRRDTCSLPHLYRRSSNRDEGTEGFSLLLGLPSSLEGPRREWFCSG